MVKPGKLLSIVPNLTGPAVTRLQLEALPQVSIDGLYNASAPGVPSGVLAVLTDRMVSCQVAAVPAECIYVNPNTLKQYGLGDLLSKGPFPVDAAFFRSLTQQFAVRILKGGEGDANTPTQTMFASHYAQSERNTGDGRGGYIVRTNPDGTTSTLFVKGVGQTPMCVPERAQAGHTDGYVTSHSAAAESIWPSVYKNLFTHTTPVTAAFFGTQTFGTGFDPRIPHEEQAVILLRGGQMFRPAHYILQGIYDRYMQFASAQQSAFPNDWPGMPLRALSQPISLDGIEGTMSPDYFFRAAHAVGVLRYRNDPDYGEVPDLQATYIEILSRFALTAAESWTNRWMQSAPSAGNAEISGGLIDVETASANPRTGPMYVLSYSFPFGHAEYTWRAVAVKMMRDSMSLSLTPAQRELYNLGTTDLAQTYARSYSTHLARQYLLATGLKAGVVDALIAQSPEDVSRLSTVLHTLASMENPGPTPYTMTREGQLLEDASTIVASKAVVDVFGFLGKWPKIYFDATLRGAPLPLDAAVRALDPIYGTTGSDRVGQEANVRQHAYDLVSIYDRLMNQAVTPGMSHYDGLLQMQADITARAAFRNQPMDRLYYWNLRRDIIDNIGQPDSATGHTVMANRDHLWPFVHQRVERSLRNVDAILRDRDVVVHPDGRIDVGVTMHGNTTYGVRADPVSGARQLFVQVPVGNVGGPYELNLKGDGQSLASVEGAKLLYKLTENGTVVAEDIQAATALTLGGHAYLGFNLPINASAYGVFEGTLEIPGVRAQTMFEYAYVSPDGAAVRELARGRRQHVGVR